jgi:hypothetical protein
VNQLSQVDTPTIAVEHPAHFAALPIQSVNPDLGLGHWIVSLVPTASAAEADADESFGIDEVARESVAVLFLPRLVFFAGRGTSGPHGGAAPASCPVISGAMPR